MCCPVSGWYLGNSRYGVCMQTAFVVNAVWIGCILEVTDSLYLDYKIYPHLFIALHQAYIRTKIYISASRRRQVWGTPKPEQLYANTGCSFFVCREFNYLRVTLEIVYWVKVPFPSLMKATKSPCGEKWKMTRGFVCTAPLHAPRNVSVQL